MSFKLAKLKATSHGPIKVDHPLAKYNSKGDLYCLLCNNLIKNANIWKVHLSSKGHKEKMILFKSGKTCSSRQTTTLKRPSHKVADAPPRSLKKCKIDTSGTEEISKSKSVVKSGILKQSSKVIPKLPDGFIPKSKQNNILSIQNQNDKIDSQSVEKLRAVEAKSNLPSGFFDDNIMPIESAICSAEAGSYEETEPDNTEPTKALPEGFFDDAREDAKARKIEYKDPQEVEWEKFQNEMEQEDIKYNMIIEEDDQRLRVERDFDIGIEQKLWDYRVESIASSAKSGDICIEDKHAFEVKVGDIKYDTKPKEETLESVDIKMEDESEDSESEDDVMDWRTKREHLCPQLYWAKS